MVLRAVESCRKLWRHMLWDTLCYELKPSLVLFWFSPAICQFQCKYILNLPMPSTIVLFYSILQFLSNFFKYSSSNFSSSHPYNILAVKFPGNSPLLKSCFSALSIFSYLLISVSLLSLNSSNTSFAFPRSSFLFQVSCSTKPLPLH